MLPRGTSGGKKQMQNRELAGLIGEFHDWFGWEETKRVFNLKDNTLVAVLQSTDRQPSITRAEKAMLKALNNESQLFNLVKEHRQLKGHVDEMEQSDYEFKSRLILCLESLEKNIAIMRLALSGAVKPLSESHFEAGADKIYVTSTQARNIIEAPLLIRKLPELLKPRELPFVRGRYRGTHRDNKKHNRKQR